MRPDRLSTRMSLWWYIDAVCIYLSSLWMILISRKRRLFQSGIKFREKVACYIISPTGVTFNGGIQWGNLGGKLDKKCALRFCVVSCFLWPLNDLWLRFIAFPVQRIANAPHLPGGRQRKMHLGRGEKSGGRADNQKAINQLCSPLFVQQPPSPSQHLPQ